VKANRFYEIQSGLPLELGIEVGFHNALSGTRLEKPFPGISGNVCRTQAAHALIGLEPLTFIDRVNTSLICSAKVNRSIATLGLFYLVASSITRQDTRSHWWHRGRAAPEINDRGSRLFS